jgi:ligand-binding sensor domain-containing protein
MKQVLTLIITIVLFHHIKAQDELAIGQWQSLLPYTTFVNATQNDEFLFFSTDLSIMLIDKEENTNRFISKVDGLSETGVVAMKANPESGLLVVTYDNAVFDLISDDGITGFVEISRDGNFTDRSINNITFDGSQFLYFATGFGVVKFDIENQEFVYTVATGMSVSDIAIFNDNIYISTEDGIFFIDKSDNANQQAFGDWQLLAANFNFPPNYLNFHLESKDDFLYMDIDNALARFDGNEWETVRSAEEAFIINFISADHQRVVAGIQCDACEGALGTTDKIVTWDPTTELITELNNNCVSIPTFAIEDEQGNIWSTDRFENIRKTDSQGNNCENLSFNSPFSQFVSEIAVIDNSVHIASGGLLVNGNNAQRRDGVFIRDQENNWSVFSSRTFPELEAQQAQADFYRVIGHPSNGKIYYGTYWGGLIEQDGESITIFNDTNSSLQGAVGDEQRERIAGLAFDAQENLWMTNNSAPSAISVLSNGGEWDSIDVPLTNLGQLAIDRQGYKWAIVQGTAQGILVFDENGTIDDTSDDRTRIITTNNSNLPDNEVLSIEADRQGDIWVGTTDGVVVFECGSSAFEASCIGNKRVVEENDIDDESENLLKGEVVNTIGIDGADRKWFGTSSGVFVQDDNGTKNIAFYNEDNSPLLDNNVIDIAFNNETGDVFIGTEKGVIQLRGEAIAGGVVNSSDIYAFPNPVRPNYDGPIAIKGLAENANVKITDISGVLIFETTALGGQAIWNGRDYNGRKASTGVYLVFSTADGLINPDAASTKILFIK